MCVSLLHKVVDVGEVIGLDQLLTAESFIDTYQSAEALEVLRDTHKDLDMHLGAKGSKVAAAATASDNR